MLHCHWLNVWKVGGSLHLKNLHGLGFKVASEYKTNKKLCKVMVAENILMLNEREIDREVLFVSLVFCSILI